MKRLISLTFLAVAAAGLGGCRSATPAITINGEEVAIDEFDAELRDLAQSEYFRSQAPDLFVGDCAPSEPEPAADGIAESDLGLFDEPDGSASAGECRISESGVNQWATNRILLDLYLAEADRRGIAPADAEVEASRAQYPEGFFDGMPEAFAERWVLENATVTALAQSLTSNDPTVDPVAELQVQLVGEAEVDLDPRYGTWDPTSSGVIANSVSPLRERTFAGGD